MNTRAMNGRALAHDPPAKTPGNLQDTIGPYIASTKVTKDIQVPERPGTV